MTRRLGVIQLGRMGYRATHQLQRALAERLIQGSIAQDLLLLVEHEPTITLGRGTRASSLPIPPEELARRGLTVAEVERGGDVTWHGPGQLVGYPILDLHRHRLDLHWYLRQVEASVIGALARLGVAAQRRPGLTGVWTGDRKIASIGVHVRHWVTTHGFALNVSNDLGEFGWIIPCGIEGVRMTSLAECLPEQPPETLAGRARDAVAAAVAQVFELEADPMALEEISEAGPGDWWGEAASETPGERVR
jgi:lipoyl(octanoyl) transferase